MATVNRSIAVAMIGADYPIPPYSELLEEKHPDDRTGEQIVEGLISRLREAEQ